MPCTTLIDRLEAATAGLAAADAGRRRAGRPARRHHRRRRDGRLGRALWSGDAGEALADALARLRAAWASQAAIAGGEWPALLAAMLEPEIVRPGFGRHPRLAIWGPLEARLQRADLLVLGGLNEGTWPPAVETGPWLNRPMRAALGLPQPERRIGLSAHDFVAALGAERVLLTRAEREGGAPTVPSRWLARLDALFGYEPGGNAAPPEYIQRGQHELPRLGRRARPARAATGRGRAPSRARRSRRGRRGSRSPASSNGGAIPTASMRGASWDWRRSIRSKPSSGAADRGSALHDALDEFLARPSVRPAAARRHGANSRRWARSISARC